MSSRDKKIWQKPQILNVLPIKQTLKPKGSVDGAGGSQNLNKKGGLAS